jgi:Uma2 family endonuclease
MSQMARPVFTPITVADVLGHVGGVAADRVRMNPMPGTATEQDLLDLHARENRLCELVDGVLVEKSMGSYEAYLAAYLVELIGAFVRKHRLGIVMGPDGALMLASSLVRIPDVSFISFQQKPADAFRMHAIARLYPDLAIEVLSVSNTPQEMNRKLRDYFKAGSRQVWFVDSQKKQVSVYAAPESCVTYSEFDKLTGGDLLPGFELSIRDLFLPPAGP